MTAVEWLVNVVQSCIAPNFIPKEIVKQAKEMEKQQIIDAYTDGRFSGQTNWGYGNDITAEQYYNEKFEKK